MSKLIDIRKLVENNGQLDGVPKNPRFIEDDKFDKLMMSIEKRPKMLTHRPLMVVPCDDKFVVLGGNMRLRACQKLGWDKVPCTVLELDEISPETMREYTLLDNIAYGKDDWDLMKDEWMPLVDLEELGMDIPEEYKSLDEIDKDLDEPIGDENAIPEITECRSRYGDVFICGNHRVACGDATNMDDISALMAGELADFVWTDPPYNVAIKGKAGKIMNDDMSNEHFSSFLMDIYKSYYAFMRDGAVIYVAHSEGERIAFTEQFVKAGLKFSQNLIWVKQSGVMNRQDFNYKHEPILYGWKEGAAHYFCEDYTRTTIIDDSTNDDLDYKKMTKDQLLKVVRAFKNQEQRPESTIYYDRPTISELHPTMKPVGLVELMMGWSSKEGWSVLDLFGGSGTTLIAAEKTKRRARILELDPKFCDVIVKRYQDYTGKKAVLERTGERFDDLEVYKNQ